ncbi:hypothetical protein ACFQ0M_08660 [Kitasatospora aburaviensis]
MFELPGTALTLLFLSLPENGDPAMPGQHLRDVWQDEASTEALPMGQAPLEQRKYTRDDVFDVLSNLLTRQGATLVRVQDPAPDFKLLTGLGLVEHDHQDHITTAWFADEAVRRYARSRPQVVTEHYRDYNIADGPADLDAADTRDKNHVFKEVYVPRDALLDATLQKERECRRDGDGIYLCYANRIRQRTPRLPNSVTSDRNGALHAYAVRGGRLYEWVEDYFKSWQGPYLVAGPASPLTEGLSVGRDEDGRIEVFTRNADTGEVIAHYQTVTGWAWKSLGSPNTVSAGPGSALTNDALRVSAPAVASNGDGRLQLFVRNAGGGVSSIWQTAPNGGWTAAWADMLGVNVQGTPSAMTTRDGRIELFAWTAATDPEAGPWTAPSARIGVLHWYQPAPNQPFRFDETFPQVAPTSDPAIGMDQDGRLELLYRQLDGLEPKPTDTTRSSTMSLHQLSPGGGWSPASGALGGAADQGGYGTPAAVTPGDGRMVTAVRNRGGGVSISRQDAPNGPFGGWTDLGGSMVGVPAAGVDRDGLADLVITGTNGLLYHNRQRPDGSFRGWAPMG